MRRFGAIDIGSNAVRLLIADIQKSDNGFRYIKNQLVRVPLRLGDDAFLNKKISEKKVADLVSTMMAFKKLMEVFKVDKYLACATSAMREAENEKEILQKVIEEANVEIEIIEGQREADIIYSNHIERKLDAGKNYLYIDVGGGSTELSLFLDSKMTVSKSFNIGTIRILDNQDRSEEWDAMKNWIKTHTKDVKKLSGIGTGGNINKLFKMSGTKENHALPVQKLLKMHGDLESCSLKERMKKFDLKSDRADVIVPAAQIFISVAKWAAISEIFVPKVGLVDGIINLLMEENLEN